MAVTATKAVDVWRMKKWWQIIAPAALRGAFIGETPALTIDEAVNRTVNISLAAVIGDVKKQNVNVTFKIIGVQDNKLMTRLIKYEIVPSFIRRCVRKDRTRIDDSFICKTSDGISVKIKPFLMTAHKVNGSRETLLGKLARATLRDAVSKMTYDVLIEEIISNRLQKNIAATLRKVVPLRTSEIRVMEIIEDKKGAPEAAVKVEEKIEEPKEKVAEIKAEEGPKEEVKNKKESKKKAISKNAEASN
jgi:small subunit ribosomal protein S3Ae